jgi:DNA-binding CsgD family transcriptional regulator
VHRSRPPYQVELVESDYLVEHVERGVFQVLIESKCFLAEQVGRLGGRASRLGADELQRLHDARVHSEGRIPAHRLDITQDAKEENHLLRVLTWSLSSLTVCAGSRTAHGWHTPAPGGLVTSGRGSANSARGIDGPRQHVRASVDLPASYWLTPRERIVLEHLVERLTYSEIAERLYISVNTVKSHVARVYAKLGVNGRRGAIEQAHQLGLLDDERRQSLPREYAYLTIAQQARQLVGADYAVLTVPNDNGSALTIRAVAGDDLVGLEGSLVPLNDSMAGTVIRDRAPQLLMDVWSDRRVFRPPGWPQDTGPALFVPLWAGREVLGSLTVANRRDREPFTYDDIKTITTFAVHASVALDDSRRQEAIDHLSSLDENRQYIVAIVRELLAEDPEATNRLSETIDRLDAAIKEIRDAVFPYS